MNRIKEQYDPKKIDADIKLMFVIEGMRRQAVELLDMQKKSTPPTKKELMAIAGCLTVAIAVVSDIEIPDAGQECGSQERSAKSVVEDARNLLMKIQKERDQEKLTGNKGSDN